MNSSEGPAMQPDCVMPDFHRYTGPDFPDGTEIAITVTKTLIKLPSGMYVETSIASPFSVAVLSGLTAEDRAGPVESLQTEVYEEAGRFALEMVRKYRMLSSGDVIPAIET